MRAGPGRNEQHHLDDGLSGGFWVARLRKKDAQAEPFGLKYCQQWPRRDTFNGVGVGRKARSEAEEAVRLGSCFLTSSLGSAEQGLKSVHDDPLQPVSKLTS